MAQRHGNMAAALRIFERRVIRNVFSPLRLGDNFHLRCNSELSYLFSYLNALQHIVTCLPFSKLLCHCSHLTDTTISTTITVCSIQLFTILLTTATVFFFHSQLHTSVIEFLLTIARFLWAFCIHTTSVRRTS